MALKMCLLLLGLFLHLAAAKLNLELVQVILRHGERTPRVKEMYPNDPYNVSAYEPWGTGQLTNEGKMTEYKIGKMLRGRYNDFLGEVYRPSDIHSVSTNVDRTKMSLHLVLAGLYPVNSLQTWNKNLAWMPVPTHYLPEKFDTLMKPHLSPKYTKALEEIKNSVEVRQRMAEHKNLFDYLSAKTGFNKITSDEIYEIYNLLTAQKNMNLTLPEWCTDAVYKQMQDIVVLEYLVRSYTTELKRLNGGTLIKRFLDNINLNAKREKPRKMYLYSGHEVNIASFTRAHNFSEPRLPAYGSAILFEKLRNDTGKHFVRIVLWTGVTEELVTLKLANCDEICPMENYLKIVKDVIPSEDEVYSFLNNLTKGDMKTLYEQALS